MIEVKNLFKTFDGKIVLDGISTQFYEGKTNMIIGKSGSGKTVLMKSLVGLIRPDSGEVLYDKQDFLQMNAAEVKALRTEIGMLFQGSALFDSLTVLENIMFPLKMFTHQSSAEREKRARFCIERVNLTGADKQYPSEISGGMQKRVAIARAIALNPKYLFCDEPNSGLDPQTSILIDELIKDITREYNITTIINTHDMSSVLGMGENITFLNQGRSEWLGTKDDIFSSTNEVLNDFVFASNFFKTIKGQIGQNAQKKGQD
ncbi:MAG: ABC transporter ATP-binding protein [Porphyromonadaceae bacterium]|nr:ABC transporter ATP-binding protein [Porphyromonadaceae bacterium]